MSVMSAPWRVHSATVAARKGAMKSQHVIKGHIPRVTVTTQLGCAGMNRTSDTPVPELAENSARTCGDVEREGCVQNSVSCRARITSFSRAGVDVVSTQTGGNGRPSFRTCEMRALIHTTRVLDMVAIRLEVFALHAYNQDFPQRTAGCETHPTHPQDVLHFEEPEHMNESVIVEIGQFWSWHVSGLH